MHVRFASTFLRAALAAALVVSGFGSAPAFAAVTGGGRITPGFTNEAAPNAPKLVVDPSAAAGIMANVKDAVAHAKPLRGQPVMRIGKAPYGAVPAGSSANLTNHGGPVVKAATLYNLYVNGTPATFGYPGSFLADNAINGANSFLHVTDQFVGSNANNRYTYGGYLEPTYNTSSTLHDADIYNIINAASNYYNTSGYGAVFNVFLKPGVTECSTSAGGCYGTAPFTFCAYHGSVNLLHFNGFYLTIKHLLYTVMPYQQVSGCETPTNTLYDDTASTLSHETAELITDPDLNAWWNSSTGQENGDQCRFNYSNLYVGSAGTFFNRTFNIQQEWLNDANNGNGGCGY